MANLEGLNSSGQLITQLARQSRPQNSTTDVVSNDVVAQAGQGGNSLPQVGDAVPNTAADNKPTAQQIETVVAKLSDFVQAVQRDLSFTVDDNTGKTVIIVKDTQTDEVIRQIPSEDLLQLAQNLRDLQESLEGSKGNLLEVRV